MISVIIPVYNEEEILKRNSLYFRSLSKKVEFIFVDGGSSDGTREIASGFAKVIRSEKGRATQMNYGAQFAKGDVLLFLHVDTIVNDDVLQSIERILNSNHCIGGCLTQRIDKNGLIYRFIEGLGNIRARITRVFYGDQGIFMRKSIFLKIGGFPKVPIMEDVLFTKKLRKEGKTLVLSNKIMVSPRRWDKQGILKTALIYSLINILFWLRFPLDRINNLYDDVR